jgi:hypothetical protein
MERRCETVREINTSTIVHMCAIVTIGYQQTYTIWATVTMGYHTALT